MYLYNINKTDKKFKKTNKKKHRNRKKTKKNKNIIRKQYSNIFFNSMKNYIQNISQNQYEFAVHEAGGGGDCLFHSIAAGIDIANSIPKIKENRKLNAKDLRKIVGDSILEWDEKKFKEYIEIARISKLYGEWSDRWDPNYVTNKKILSKIFSIMGNIHWGTDFDISILSDKLEIGIIVFQANINDARIYCIPSENKKKKYYMFIYNNGGHYQLAGIKKIKSTQYQSVLLPKDIPIFLKTEYKKLCNSQII